MELYPKAARSSTPIFAFLTSRIKSSILVPPRTGGTETGNAKGKQKKGGFLPGVFGAVAFLVVGLCLCTLFLLIYPGGELCRLFEYALVLMCFAFACGHRSEDPDGILAMLALLCTAGADFFLVTLKEEQWLPGMAVFCFAQFFWALRLLLLESGRRRIGHSLVWAFTCGTLLVVAILLARGADTLLLLSAVYASCLLTTVLFSWLTPRNVLFTLGMTLFLGCDIFVAVNNAALYVDLDAYPLLKTLYDIPFNMMWAFYGPSQMLLALSSAGSRRER